MKVINMKRLLSTAVILAGMSPTVALASFDDWLNTMYGQESGGGGYAAGKEHVNNPKRTAMGKGQIILENWEKMGYLDRNGGNTWNGSTFTKKARDMGVNSVDDLLNTPAGHRMQDQAISTFAKQEWDYIKNGAGSH